MNEALSTSEPRRRRSPSRTRLLPRRPLAAPLRLPKLLLHPLRKLLPSKADADVFAGVPRGIPGPVEVAP